MAEHDDLDRDLRALAERLDRESRTTTPEAAMARRDGARAPSRRPVLAAAAAGIAAVMALAVGLVVAAQPDDGTDVTTEEPPSTTALPTTTSTPPPTTAVYTGADFTDLPDAGIAVSDGEDQLQLLAFDGTELARATTSLARDMASSPTRQVVAAYPGGLELVDADPAEAPDGCDEAAGGGGLRVALCGGEPQNRTYLARVAPTGEAETLLLSAPDSHGVGHWRWAIPSPNAEWVLAQWSGECEVPLAYLVSADGGTVRPVGGDGVNSTGFGWTDDGRMLVQFGPGRCGSGMDEPGIYLVDPDTGDRQLVRADTEGRLVVGRWERRFYGNEAELIALRALDELGLEGCCGEPSHGGSGLTSGAVWQGEDIAITASPTGTGPDLPVSASEPGDLDGAPVLYGETDGRPFVAFTCGSYLWHVGYGLQTEPASEAGVRGLAEALIPHLYCTVGLRPEP